MHLFGFILFGTFCASCTRISVSFYRFGNFSAIIYSNTFSIPFALYSPSETPIMCRLECFILLYYPIDRVCCFHLSFCLLFWLVSIILSSRSHLFFFQFFFLLCHLVCYSLLLDWFLSWHLNCLILIGTPRLSHTRLVSSSLSQLSAFLLIIFLNSFNIFITSFLNWGSSIDWWALFHSLFFQGISLVFSLRAVPLLFHFT